MTRGQIAIITNDKKIHTSIEFNGDMYIENGFGEKILEELPKIKTLEDYEKYVVDFNNQSHNYEDYDNFSYELTREFVFEELVNMKDDYFKKWGSDYLYIKNLSDEIVTFIDRNGKQFKLNQMQIVVLNFGRFYYFV